LPDTSDFQPNAQFQPDVSRPGGVSRHSSTTSLRQLGQVLLCRRRLLLSVVGGLMLACLLYCLIAPNQYEASAKVGLRTSPASSLSLDAPESYAAASILSASVQQETLATVLRSDQLAWRVITDLKLYQAPGFMAGTSWFEGSFASRFPEFRPEAPSSNAESYLLERFKDRLRVQTLPRTLLIQIRFRSRDAALSASVVNDLIHVYEEQESDSRVQATAQASAWLESQLKDLKKRMDEDRQRLSAFQREHGILSTPETEANGQQGESQHDSILVEIDELGRQLVTATADRIQRETEFRSASEGDPELVIASGERLQNQTGNFPTAVLQQIHNRRSDLEQEQAQLSIEHGPNFPRVVEIRGLLQDLDRQKQTEDAKLVERFHSAWQTAIEREQMVEKTLDERTQQGLQQNQAATEYAVMRQEANSSHDLYMQVKGKMDEAELAAGIHISKISVVDRSLPPAKPVAPDLPLYLAITFFVSLWLAVGAALMLESLHPSAARAMILLLAAFLIGITGHAQAPTPSTSGLPSGVARPQHTEQTIILPDAKQAPAVWDHSGASQAGASPLAATQAAAPMPAPIAAGDFLDVSEFRTPEFHSSVRVSAAGTVKLPMIGEVQPGGLDEQQAALAIEAALIAQGILLHPRVSVLVTAYAGQDVSVLGEVTRPGVYPFTLHHRLLDLISAASGLSPNAGRLVNIFHRDDAKTPHPVVLDPSGTDTTVDHNPELAPGDTVQVSRAGLVYVIGDVVRPGGFPVDPAQGLTVVQALSLAWGPSQNAATRKAILIREQKGGRTLTTLDLKRMIHGQEPDQPIHDRDILFVPDSTAKNLWNKTVESAIQSAVGVTLYSALVYSQRY
jgi:polysaccharide export outer membrane protein